MPSVADAASAQRPSPETADDPANAGVDRMEVISRGWRSIALWSLRLLFISAATAVLWWVGKELWTIILPTLLALIVSSVLWPPVRFLTQRRVPASLAVFGVMIGSFAIIGGVFWAMAPSVASQAEELANHATQSIYQLQDWVQGPPLNIADSQLTDAVNQVTTKLQESATNIAQGVYTGAAAFASFVVTLVLTLVLTFFFLKDGPRFLPFVRSVVGRGAGRHLTELLTRVWATLGGFIRTQALVSLVDAILIGAGLLVLSVPLAFPLAVLTFFGGFIPIVGAFTAGALAIGVALVSSGVKTALIVLVIIIVVQQLEGNVLQPFLQSKSMNLHPVIVLLAVAAGSQLYGIVGAFLAVPVAASVGVTLRYLSEQIDLRTGDRTVEEVSPLTDEGKQTAALAQMGAVRYRRSAVDNDVHRVSDSAHPDDRHNDPRMKGFVDSWNHILGRGHGGPDSSRGSASDTGSAGPRGRHRQDSDHG